MDSLKTLLSNRGDLAKVSRLSGIDQSTISRIARGVTPNPGLNTVNRIESAIREMRAEKKAAKKKSRQNAEKKHSRSRDNQDSAAKEKVA